MVTPPLFRAPYRPSVPEYELARLHEATAEHRTTEGRPTDDPRCVFDFHSGLRLCVFRAASGPGSWREVVVAAAQPGTYLGRMAGIPAVAEEELLYRVGLDGRRLLGCDLRLLPYSAYREDDVLAFVQWQGRPNERLSATAARAARRGVAS